MRFPPAPMMYSPIVRINTTSELSLARITVSTVSMSCATGAKRFESLYKRLSFDFQVVTRYYFWLGILAGIPFALKQEVNPCTRS